MKCKSAILLAAVLFFVAAAFAQAPPTPAPELKKLDYFVGTWSFDGDTKPSPFGPGGKFTGTENLEWMEGSFFLVSHSTGSGAMGNMKALAAWGYNADEKVYTFHEFNSRGEEITAKGTVVGDSWTWTNEDKMGKGRYSMKIVSPTAYTFKFELAPPGGEFTTIMEGKATKK